MPMLTRPSGWRDMAVLLTVGALLAACHPCGGGDEITECFGPVNDAAAMTEIASAWNEAGGLSLSLCEDVAKAEATPANGCASIHVVRGGGLGAEQCVTHSTGGCCAYRMVAYVHGVAAGAGLPDGTAVSGTVDLGTQNDPYGHPYEVYVDCYPAGQCIIRGKLSADGRLDVTLTLGAGGSGPESHHVLDRAGPATCP